MFDELTRHYDVGRLELQPGEFPAVGAVNAVGDETEVARLFHAGGVSVEADDRLGRIRERSMEPSSLLVPQVHPPLVGEPEIDHSPPPAEL